MTLYICNPNMERGGRCVPSAHWPAKRNGEFGRQFQGNKVENNRERELCKAQKIRDYEMRSPEWAICITWRSSFKRPVERL